jgi:riboflavin-specific deaminase-like protein
MKVLSNLAITLDGKIAPADRSFLKLGTPEDWRRMIALRSEADAVLFGASTLRAYGGFALPPKSTNRVPANIIYSSNLEGLDPKIPFFKNKNRVRILLHTKPLKSSTKKKLSNVAEIIQVPQPHSGTWVKKWLLPFLESRNMRRLLVEGGGTVMWEFVRENVIDEYHVTLTPKILGGKAPSLVEGKGFSASQILNLRLVEADRVKDELFLIYSKT